LPEGDAEENGAAGVETQNVADFVGTAQVVGRVNRQIMSSNQSRQRRRHERAFQQTRGETGNVIGLVITRRRPTLGKNQPQTDRGQGDDFNCYHFRSGKAGGSCDLRLNGFGHPAEGVPASDAGQADNVATGTELAAFNRNRSHRLRIRLWQDQDHKAYKLDLVPSRFIIPPMNFDDDQCFHPGTAAGFKFQPVFFAGRAVFCSCHQS